MYTWSSEAINAALSRGVYYTGSLYDVPFTASVCWLIAAALLARAIEHQRETRQYVAPQNPSVAVDHHVPPAIRLP